MITISSGVVVVKDLLKKILDIITTETSTHTKEGITTTTNEWWRRKVTLFLLISMLQMHPQFFFELLSLLHKGWSKFRQTLLPNKRIWKDFCVSNCCYIHKKEEQEVDCTYWWCYDQTDRQTDQQNYYSPFWMAYYHHYFVYNYYFCNLFWADEDPPQSVFI